MIATTITMRPCMCFCGGLRMEWNVGSGVPGGHRQLGMTRGGGGCRTRVAEMNGRQREDGEDEDQDSKRSGWDKRGRVKQQLLCGGILAQNRKLDGH